MWAIKVAFALSLGVTGIIGCASSERLYDRTMTPAIPIPQTSSPAANLADSVSGATSLESSAIDAEPPAISMPNPLAQSLEAPPTAQFKPIEPKPERVTSEGKTAQPIKSSPPSAQAAPSLGADNRLLELLDKDLEKAVEQSKERRQLQFSKEVVEHARVRHFVKYYSTTGK